MVRKADYKVRGEMQEYWEGTVDEQGNNNGDGKKQYIEVLVTRIESLLPGATSVNLGSDYEQQSNRHKEEADKYDKLFGRLMGWSIFVIPAIITIFISLLILEFIYRFQFIYCSDISSFLIDRIYLVAGNFFQKPGKRRTDSEC